MINNHEIREKIRFKIKMAKEQVFSNHFSSLDFELATKQNLQPGVDNEP